MFEHVDIPKLHLSLKNWFSQHARKLPWREDKSLYKTVLSEFMLQQTRVDTALPYFHRWLNTFPDFQSLAQASEEAVLHQWEGLGYYNRARNLHKLAKKIIQLDNLPQNAKEWQQLPGIGPYTAAAISSMVFQQKNAVVDGNVVRVLSRLMQIQTSFESNAEAVKKITPIAEALIDPANPGIYNEALMELGATVCTKSKPACNRCPWLNFCKTGPANQAENYPVIQRKKMVQKVIFRLFLLRDGKLFLHKKPESSKRLANLCELPELNEDEIKKKSYQKVAKEKRSITHHIITEEIYRPNSSYKVVDEKHCFWQDVDQIDRITLSGPHRKWIQKLLNDKLADSDTPA